MVMKKYYFVFCMLLGIAVALPAQNVVDDLYYVPKKSKAAPAKATATTTRQETTRQETTPAATTVVTSDSPATTRTVVIRKANGEERDVDEYNRRYTSRDNKFNVENDTCIV